jgi:TDG/mug DNA glycosylase family protein
VDHKLADLLATDLRVVFVGTAAGRRSAALGHYYAGRGNRFWRTLFDIGLTPRRFGCRPDSGGIW